MFCAQCGTRVAEAAENCPNCGKAMQGGVATTAAKQDSLATPPSSAAMPPPPSSPFAQQNAQPIAMPMLEGWNWGAFGASLFWVAGMGLWLWFGAMIGIAILGHYIPFLSLGNLAICIYLGMKGNELAWNSPGRRWESVEQFQQTQQAWRPWGIGLFVAGLALMVLTMLLALFGFMFALTHFMH